MDIVIRVLIGGILVAVGVYFVIKTEVVYGFFGSVPSAEKYLGGGGSRLFYKLLGIIFCLVGFLWATNLWSAFLNATVGSLFPRPDASKVYTP